MNGFIPYSHDPTLALLSYVVAFFASYTALDMGERLRTAHGKARTLWLTGSAIVLGGGIWSMHFVAMLAFRISLAVSYDPGITLLSLLVAIVFTSIGFYIVSRSQLTFLRLGTAGTVVGFGVAAMHYTGMAAVRFAGVIRYDFLLKTLSVVIAVAASTVALWLALSLHKAWQKFAAALVMAAAICGMHYTGMAAVHVIATDTAAGDTGGLSQGLLALAVAGATLLLLCLALVSVFVDRRFEALAEREAIALRNANVELEREIKERLAAEEKLREAHNALEERVIERTRALANANEQLRASAQELEDARTRAEQEKVRAELASQAKSMFLSNMSHELRTPLNSILGFAQLLQFNAKDPLTQKQTRQVAQIRKSGEHLLSLIDDVLDLSKIEAGSIKLSIESVAVRPVMEQVVTTLLPLADEASVTIAPISVEAGLSVRADRTRLFQVLMNLGMNALKYNRAGGSVSLTAAGGSSGRVRITVNDTGLGIPAERQDELFQPFNRLGAEAGSIEGTGIGLTITQHLVELMDGTISFTSEADVGTTFAIELPVAAAAAVAPAQVSGSVGLEQRKRGYRLLYVEDNPSNIELMQGLVDALDGVELLTADRPHAGLALADAHKPDVIVLDIDLPEMNGFEVLRRLKAGATTSRIPVIALSAAAMPRDVERGMNAGFTHYLTKPIKVREFLRAVDTVLPEA
jgi:NO-binding membrane sensor protein with MHYT domain/CheY-like chemotaxis protein/nitrogen-specific signal transduction histidine kinase